MEKRKPYDRSMRSVSAMSRTRSDRRQLGSFVSGRGFFTSRSTASMKKPAMKKATFSANHSRPTYAHLRRMWLRRTRKKLRDPKSESGRKQPPRKSPKTVRLVPDTCEPNACARTLQLPELCWAIMDHLDGIDLFKAVATGGPFLTIVQGSPKLKRELYLEQANDGGEFEHNDLLVLSLFQDYEKSQGILPEVIEYLTTKLYSAGWGLPDLGRLPDMDMRVRGQEKVLEFNINDFAQITTAMENRSFALNMYMANQPYDINITIWHPGNRLDWLFRPREQPESPALEWIKACLTIRSCTLGSILRIAATLCRCADATLRDFNEGKLEDFLYTNVHHIRGGGNRVAHGQRWREHFSSQDFAIILSSQPEYWCGWKDNAGDSEDMVFLGW